MDKCCKGNGKGQNVAANVYIHIRINLIIHVADFQHYSFATE